MTNDRWGYGCAVGDDDNDGWPDLYVTNFGHNRLYHNNHNGTFTDTAEKGGVTLGNWSTGASFGDYDGDGRLDLFVLDMFTMTLRIRLAQCCRPSGSVSIAESTSAAGRGDWKGEPDHLFHNNGDGTFTDVSVKAGVSDPHHYYGFSSTFVDVDNDGKVDLLVANVRPPIIYISIRAMAPLKMPVSILVLL